MMSKPAELLTHDHTDLATVLNEVQLALDSGAIERIHAKLDLFWARLAVHIRAEHLHLFPAILNRLRSSADETRDLTLREAQAAVERLRADHDFFMHELARAINLLRDFLKSPDQDTEAVIGTVRETLREIEQRLVIHNELEERQIYLWATTVLSEPEQVQLASEINAQLAKRPARFALSNWSGQ